ncbi:MAG: sigma-70 family RNA polymerase sigma factor [Gemmataceae bacterium]|nr:sigma-70 family RNA polymerase sigma factor [Gemmataceae bacterium]
MNRLAALARTGLAATDDQLLARFLADRDEAAFAELVRRYAPVVWGTCRRLLPNSTDAEDAFQAAFLVLVRRARRAAVHPALGPWLYRVAVLTARNLARANRRRLPAAPLLHDIPAADPAAARADARLDLDAALGSLSDRQRSAVVLCHLQGLNRKEAADRLGCAEGTLSATLAAALKKLRARLAGRDPLAVLAAAGLTAPAGLSAATARMAAVYTTSALPTAGVSPAVAGLTEGVLRMFWVKKLALAAGLTAAAAGLTVGLGSGFGLARQDGAKAPPGGTTSVVKDSDDIAIRRMTEELRKLEADEAANKKRQDELRQARTKAEVRRHEAQQAEVRRAVGKTAYWQIELAGDGWGANPPGVGGHAVRIEEFDAAGKSMGGYTVSPDARLLKRVLAGGLADPQGPRQAVLRPQVGPVPAQVVNAVLQACKDAGLKDVIYVPVGTAYPPLFDEAKLVAGLAANAYGPGTWTGPVTLDLSKFGEKTMAVPTPIPDGKKFADEVRPFLNGNFDDPNFDLPKKP